MKWLKWGGSDDASASQDVHIVKGHNYQTKIVISRAESMNSRDPHEDSRVGSNFDEVSLGEPTKRIQHTRRALFFAIICSILLFVVIIILSVGFAKGLFRAVPDVANSSPRVFDNFTTSDERAERLHGYLITVAVNGAEGFNDPISPESQALAWMQYEDTLNLDPNGYEKQYRIDQRFALLTLWFQSNYEWFGQNNWLSGHECTWEGVKCEQEEGGRVVSELYLASNNLQGNLPPNLHLLKNLTSLNLSGNRIHGEIPKTFSSMIWLTKLHLHDNFLSQGLSLDFSKMSNLFDVNLSNNRFDGTIPASLYKVSSMSRIQLDNNKFSGGISDDIRDLANLCKMNSETLTAINNYLNSKGNDDSRNLLFDCLFLYIRSLCRCLYRQW